jgi:hypothetical protein
VNSPVIGKPWSFLKAFMAATVGLTECAVKFLDFEIAKSPQGDLQMDNPIAFGLSSNQDP